MPRRLDLGELDAPLAALLQRQEGLVRRSQLRDHGVERGHVRARVDAGRWQLVAPEVVSTDNGRLDRSQLLWRAVLHAPGPAWISHLSALARRGLTGWDRDDVHALTSRSSRPLPLAGVVVHLSDRVPLEPPDLEDGLPLVPVSRAALDAASTMPHPRIAAGLVIACLQQRITTVDELRAEVEAAGRVRHKRAVRDALDSARTGAHALSEVDAEELVRRAGLPRPRRQVVIAGRPRDLVVDLPDGRQLVIEIDGPQHDDPRARWVDAQRDAELIALGYVVLRIPAYAVRTDAAAIVAQLVEIRRAAERRARSMRDQRTFYRPLITHGLRQVVGA
jgi:very-short-patch-repair endonuclease